MSRSQRNIFKTRRDALDDRLHLHPQMRAGPHEHSTGLLQNGDLVREEVLPRRGGRIALIESCQGLSDSTHRFGSVAAPVNDLVEWRPWSSLEDEGSKVA